MLAPLPSDKFELKTTREVTVMKNGHVSLHEDKHYYSVPLRFIGQKVKLIYSATNVSVYHNFQRIAFHKREHKPYAYTTTREHLSSSRQFVSEWNPDMFIEWAAAIAPVVKEYIISILNKATYPELAYRSCVGILSNENKVGKQRLIKAIERATFYGSYSYMIIKKILSTGMDQLDFTEELYSPTRLPVHENIRGAHNYQ